MYHDKHDYDHDDALHEEGKLELMTKPATKQLHFVHMISLDLHDFMQCISASLIL